MKAFTERKCFQSSKSSLPYRNRSTSHQWTKYKCFGKFNASISEKIGWSVCFARVSSRTRPTKFTNNLRQNSKCSRKTAMSGAVATVIWRVDSTTGQVSLASFPSNVLILNNQTVIQQFPAVDSNGQDIWGLEFPK